jgi:hypothetical protein
MDTQKRGMIAGKQNVSYWDKPFKLAVLKSDILLILFVFHRTFKSDCWVFNSSAE